MAGIVVSKNGLFAPPVIIGDVIGTGQHAADHHQLREVDRLRGPPLSSVSLGLAIQQGFTAMQTALLIEKVLIGTATVVASQSLDGAVFNSVGNTHCCRTTC